MQKMNISSFESNDAEQNGVGEFIHNRSVPDERKYFEVPDDQVNFVYNPPCGNGVDEELFNRVVNVLEKQDCDIRGPDYSLYNESDMKQLRANKWNKVRYDLNEGFGSYMYNANYVYWFLVIVLVVLIVLIYKQNYHPVR